MKMTFKKIYHFISVILLCVGVAHAQKYEAENAILTNGAKKIDCASCSGGAAVEQQEGNLAIKINIQTKGFYDIYLHASAPGGEKTNVIRIGEHSANFLLDHGNQYKSIKVVSAFPLNPGNHTIEIIRSWGWINIDYLELEKVQPFDKSQISQTLVSPNPIPEASALYGFLLDHYGKRIISGVMTLNSFDESNWLKDNTGKEPALLGIDFMHSNREYSWYDDEEPIKDAKTWYDRNGIPALMWHWRDPSRTTEEFYTDGTNFDITKISDEGSAEYQAMIDDIDYIAGLLKKLQDDNVPVIWRPLHEAAGGWFWWGAKGPEPLKQLWRLMFDRMVNHHGLNNLIWVWTSEPGDADWYPGDEYVDIVGRDIYKQGDHSSQIMEFSALNDQFEGKKMISLSEVGSFPDVEALVKDHADWSWYMPWYGNFTRDSEHNSLDLWKKMFAHEYVLTLDEMPDLKNYERQEIEDVERPAVSITTGFRVPKQKPASFMAYPTVVTNELTIESEKHIRSVEVLSAIGATVLEHNVKGNSLIVSFSSLPPGVYFLKVNGAETVRIMKL